MNGPGPLRLRSRTTPGLYLLIALGVAAIFVADIVTPPDFVIWILYALAIVVCKLASWNPRAPLVVGGATCVLVLAGHFIRLEPEVGIGRLNRLMGVVTFVILALMGRQFVLRRIRLTTDDWLKAAQNALSTRMGGEQEMAELGRNVLELVADYADAPVGAIHVQNDAGRFVRKAGVATAGALGRDDRSFAPGEGLVGRAALAKRTLVVDEVPEGYLKVASGLGEAPPRCVVLVPAIADAEVMGVIELGFFAKPTNEVFGLLAAAAESVGIAFRSARFRDRQAALLEETQRQAEELQEQQVELKRTNEELEEQTERLETSQQTLEEANAQLEEQTQALQSQKEAVLAGQRQLEQKTADVERASRYKSEFLANMSHELRTPLNSSLILSKLMIDNKEGNLTPDQVRYAKSIYASGNDLLALINDVLDLSKIEAGKLDLSVEPVEVASLLENLKRRFEPLAGERKLALDVTIEPGCPETIESDAQRLLQVLANLLSNAVKFTEKGSVRLRAKATDARRIEFTVEDTGIGIAPEHHEVIFEAFRQADGSTHRKYGGTGLGLSICRELVSRLGGTIGLRSAPGEGSAFTVVLPLRAERIGARAEQPRTLPQPMAAPAPVAPRPFVADDRGSIVDPRRIVLIVEDDPPFAEILRDLGRELGFQCIVGRDAADGLALAREHGPIAVLLDIGLPDQSGLAVLELLKRDPATRHVPIHVVSAHDYEKVARELGAVGYMLKPVKRDRLVAAFRSLEERLSRKMKGVLVIEDEPAQREAIAALLVGDDVEVVAVATAEEGLAQLRGATFDCCVLDLMLPGASGFDLLDRMSKDETCSFPPVIVYTARALTRDEEERIGRLSSSVIVKGARSPERLLEETTLFLHQVESELPPERQRMLRLARDREQIFEGRRVLLVEDDVRNIFALTRVLEPKGLSVEVARNGKEALARASETPFDLVLMDIMMPEMDGLTAMREIRKEPRWKSMPIIALTAKAMPDDRLACLKAGASDYIAKPIDVEKLLSLLRVWMRR